MSENKLGQEPAFPIEGHFDGKLFIEDNKGMSKRFYAACAAMQGILANANIVNGKTSNTTYDYVCLAFECADELLKQENQ